MRAGALARVGGAVVLAVAPMLVLAALVAKRHPAPPPPIFPGDVLAPPAGTFVIATSGYRDGGWQSPFAPAYDAATANVTGNALFVPLARVLPVAPADWSSWAWDWSYLDGLVDGTHGKPFALAFVVGMGAPLPDGFELACSGGCVDANCCAPDFHTYTLARGCVDFNVPLPWQPKVQAMWGALASSAAAHLQATGAYGQLVLVHASGVSIYDEELRLPVGSLPGPADAGCPVAADTTKVRYQGFGYVSQVQVRDAFSAIFSRWATAFPDRTIGLSLFGATTPNGAEEDFPVFMDKDGGLVSQMVESAAGLAIGRLLVQADVAGDPRWADAGYLLPQAIAAAAAFDAGLGWQTQAPGLEYPDSAAGYADLLAAMRASGARYFEVWSRDVVAYPGDFE